MRFPTRSAILKRFGELADAYALAHAATEGHAKDRLFDLLLRRFDFLQMHREGMVALLRDARMEPALSAWLGGETLNSMGWLLEAAGESSRGFRGGLRKYGLAAVWAWGMRAWLRDESEDLSATMAAVDVALARADQVAVRFNSFGSAGAGFTPEAASDIGDPIASSGEVEPPLGALDEVPPPGTPPAGMPGI